MTSGFERTMLMRAEDISRFYPDGSVAALRNVNLSIYERDCIAILGKSGSGKSTLIHILGGCDDPSSGVVYWRGEPVCDREAWRRLRASNIGIIFQEFLLLPALTALENVEMALVGKGHSARERRARAAELLDMVSLGARLDHLPAYLSGGERQRVAIARSIANNPQLLLADEPTGNLDSLTSESIVDLLLRIQRLQGTALVIVTHDESIAARCPRRVVIKDGSIVEDRWQEETTAEEAGTSSASPASVLESAPQIGGVA
jgi:predicted ABC-type transport system involved in lysophospholipase L1 biosynthesis ATPase subunit